MSSSEGHPATSPNQLRNELLDLSFNIMVGLVGRSAPPEPASRSEWCLLLLPAYAKLLSFTKITLDEDLLWSCLPLCHVPQDILRWKVPVQRTDSEEAMQELSTLWDSTNAFFQVSLLWRSLVGFGRFNPAKRGPSLIDVKLVHDTEAELGVSEMVDAVISGVPPADAVGGFRGWR